MKLTPNNSSPEGMTRAPHGVKNKAKPKGEMSAIEIARHTRSDLGWMDSATLEELKWFVNERESVRMKKEAGDDRPWTDDEILHKTKFCNIYRQHDKVSKMIFDRLKDLTGPLLVYNLIMSRLTNRTDILDRLLPTRPEDDISWMIEGEAIMMNSAAYQVSPGLCRLSDYDTNRETIVHYPKTVYKEVYNALVATDHILDATLTANKAFGGHIRFAMFQIVLDYHHLTNHFNEDSEILVGQGAEALAQKFGGVKSVAIELGMKTWDAEHSLCEYRKYLNRKGKKLSSFSYKPNSMGV